MVLAQMAGPATCGALPGRQSVLSGSTPAAAGTAQGSAGSLHVGLFHACKSLQALVVQIAGRKPLRAHTSATPSRHAAATTTSSSSDAQGITTCCRRAGRVHSEWAQSAASRCTRHGNRQPHAWQFQSENGLKRSA